MENANITDKLLRNRNLQIIFLITLMAVMGVASISPAFPGIREYFGLSKAQIAYIVAAFTLPGIFLTPVMGIMADRLGRKSIVIPALILFGVAGFACMFTRNYATLILFRFFEGVGAASLGSLNITLIGDLFSGPKRTEAMGYNASVLSIGTASYPAIGGFLAHFGWYYPFILPLLAIPVAIIVLMGLNNPEPIDKQRLRTYLRNTWKIINQLEVWLLFSVSTLIFVVLYGVYITFFPSFLTIKLSASAIQIGLIMSVFSLVTAITSSQLKRIHRLIPVKIQLILSFALYTTALLLLSFVNTWGFLFIPLICFGIGHGMVIPGLQNLLVGYAPLKERAAFMSINSMVLRIGQTVGPLFIGMFFTLGGIEWVFYSGALVSCVMLVIGFFIRISQAPD